MLNRGEHQKGEIEITEQKLIYNNKFVDIYDDDVLFPSGDEGTYVRVACKPSGSVAVLPVTREGKIVLIRTYRHGTRGWGLEIPKGAVEDGEAYQAAALRELEEETGYVSENIMCLGEYSESPAIFSNKINCFVATDCMLLKDSTPEKTEAISEVLEMSVEDFLRKKEELDYVDAMSELLIYKYIIGKGEGIYG